MATRDPPTVHPIAVEYKERVGSDVMVIRDDEGTVLATLGKSGHKLEALPSEDNIVVAMRLAPSGITYRTESDPKNLFPTLATTFYNMRGAEAAGSARAAHIVIEVDKSDLERVTGRSATEIVRKLREEAKITSY